MPLVDAPCFSFTVWDVLGMPTTKEIFSVCSFFVSIESPVNLTSYWSYEWTLNAFVFTSTMPKLTSTDLPFDSVADMGNKMVGAIILKSMSNALVLLMAEEEAEAFAKGAGVSFTGGGDIWCWCWCWFEDSTCLIRSEVRWRNDANRVSIAVAPTYVSTFSWISETYFIKACTNEDTIFTRKAPVRTCNNIVAWLSIVARVVLFLFSHRRLKISSSLFFSTWTGNPCCLLLFLPLPNFVPVLLRTTAPYFVPFVTQSITRTSPMVKPTRAGCTVGCVDLVVVVPSLRLLTMSPSPPPFCLWTQIPTLSHEIRHTWSLLFEFENCNCSEANEALKFTLPVSLSMVVSFSLFLFSVARRPRRCCCFFSATRMYNACLSFFVNITLVLSLVLFDRNILPTPMPVLFLAL